MRHLVRPAALLGAALLALTTADLAHSAATPAYDAPRAGSTSSNLDVALTAGSIRVAADESVSVSGTYSCDDASGTDSVPIAVTFVQKGRVASGSTTVDCQSTGGTWDITVPFPSVQADTEIVANAEITDGDSQATDSAHLVRHNAFFDRGSANLPVT
ncbi:hypothetical protein ACFQ6N_32215 [Kitasatospora sp. NPDC056446]|uniref:hypothetical protein n=1 Tax=Kitasatospora sp. NPDC056446 TaxID=3345819 RepID=UPI0036CC9A4C